MSDRQPFVSMASVAELLAAASDGDSQSESAVNPVQRNVADIVPETEDDDEDVAAVAVVVQQAKKKKHGNIKREWEDILTIARQLIRELKSKKQLNELLIKRCNVLVATS